MGVGWPPPCLGMGTEGDWKPGNSGRTIALATTGTKFLINILSVYKVTSVGKHLPNFDHGNFDL